MKFTKFVLLAAAIMACACEKEMPTDTMPEATNNMTRIKTEILSFASVEEMEEQIGILRIMAPEEMAGWYAVQNFESQYDALYRAAEEIDNATTLEEAEAIKTKYSPYFLYNDNPADEEPFNPYLPNEKPDYAYVCNISGEVMIGGEVVNYNTITNVADTHEYQLAHAPMTRSDNITRDNILKRTAGKHKFWAEGRMDQNEIVCIEFTAHKKTIFGWNKCQMSYHIRSGRWLTNDGWRSYSPWFLQFKENTPDGAWTKKIPSHTFVPVGRPKYNQTGVMNFRIYSKGTGPESEGNLTLYYTSTKE
ncbi:DUF4848 domain-containing protein [Alistipes sp.]|uniref:DUF4848 domain-containing protein n=1 Tax=Alistipes sp. TaxID=1872444 RepID=UPI00262C0333|nr:DUF4848 domain-containing protein [Alistipes sp.]HUN14373.1 DUF4848 domain-containing protein [Alistipes sp.]